MGLMYCEDKQDLAVLLTDELTYVKLQLLHSLVLSCFGPYGRLKIIKLNASTTSSALVITSTSSRLFSNIRTSHPIVNHLLRLLDSSGTGYTRYRDGGLRRVVLATSLILRGIKLCTNTLDRLPRHNVIAGYSAALTTCLEYLSSPSSCACVRRVPANDFSSMLALIRSVIGSKPACHLSAADVNHIAILLLEAFLGALPDVQESVEKLMIPEVKFLTFSGADIADSFASKGVVIPIRYPIGKNVTQSSRCGFSVILFSCSLNGDLIDGFDDNNSSEYQKGWNIQTETIVTNHILSDWDTAGMECVGLAALNAIVDDVIALEIKILACQKCVHPSIKQRLSSAGVIVLDRVSSLHIGAVASVSGAYPISEIPSTIDRASLGHLASINDLPDWIISVIGYPHVWLTPIAGRTSKAVWTVVLLGPDEITSSELETVCRSALFLLADVLYGQHCGKALVGMGVTDNTLANEIMKRLKGPVAETFSQSLRELAKAVDPTDFDGISINDEKDPVLDGWSTYTESLQSAVDTACSVLRLRGIYA